MVPRYVSIEVDGRTHTASYAEKDGWVGVTSEHGTKRAKLHEVPAEDR
ncbi:MAG: hypothetical protein ACLQJR_21520 [Stellaceae bacterium]